MAFEARKIYKLEKRCEAKDNRSLLVHIIYTFLHLQDDCLRTISRRTYIVYIILFSSPPSSTFFIPLTRDNFAVQDLAPPNMAIHLTIVSMYPCIHILFLCPRKKNPSRKQLETTKTKKDRPNGKYKTEN